MTSHEPESGLEALEALRRALPTSRHAAMVVDSVIAAMGPNAFVETTDRGEWVRVFRRDVMDPEAVVPWPILRFVRGRRLAHVSDGVSPPTDEVPPGTDESPLRLRGAGPGEIEFSDGDVHVSLTFASDGRLCETSRGRWPGPFADLSHSIDAGTRTPVEAIIDHVIALDPGRAGPGRLRVGHDLPTPIQAAWQVALRAVRDASFSSHVLPSSSWVTSDGIAGIVVQTGDTRDEAIDRCKAALRDLRPQRPKPQPPPTLSAETLAKLSLHGPAPFMITAPPSDTERTPVTPENTPYLVVDFPKPPTTAPPPNARWVRLLDDRGGTQWAALHHHADSIVIVRSDLVAQIGEAELASLLSDAETAAGDWLTATASRTWPAELPVLDTLTWRYSVDPIAGQVGQLRARVTGLQQTHGRPTLRAEDLAGGVIKRQPRPPGWA